MLQEHGITMLPVDDDTSIVASAVESGQTVVLTGKFSILCYGFYIFKLRAGMIL